MPSKLRAVGKWFTPWASASKMASSLGRSPKIGPLLKRAIEATTKLKVEMILDTGDAGDGADESVFVTVGVNP
jgi:hypothetical protein